MMETIRTIDYTMKGMTHEMMMDLELWLSSSLFDAIRSDTEIDNLNWVSKWISIIDDVRQTRKDVFCDEVGSRQV